MILNKMKWHKLIIAGAILTASLLLTSACNWQFDEPEKEATAHDYIYESFKEWYLWYDQIPEIDPNEYETYSELIDAIRVDVDRWSYAGSYAETMKLFEKGEFKGFGAGFKLDYDKQIKITHVYAQSPFGVLGVERGWVVNSVNGFTSDNLAEVNNTLSSGQAVSFVFTDHHNATHQHTVQKESFTMNTVLYSDIIHKEGKRIGYLVFDSFVDASKNELVPIIERFNNEQVTDLVVDLRYNGGGVVGIANMLVSVIGGEKVAGQVIMTLLHNDKKSANNKPTLAGYDGVSLDIEKVYFITTAGTASASELLINNLNPFMEVKTVGSPTHGKPVGMYILSVKEIDLAILPICFKNTNQLDYGDYFDGLPATITEADDLNHNWGHPAEAMLNAAINDILNPVVAVASPLKSSLIERQQLLEYTGINQIVNAW
jgi:carboxyl-terminal processing protease